jgi:mRNA-degrading endonuclease RelE of RelBE toxin-antitoxin system
MFSIKLTAKAKRELRNLSKLDNLSIGEIIENLKEDPLVGKPLSRELIKKFSYRTGVYRVIYLVNRKDQVVIILSAGHRSTVYN